MPTSAIKAIPTWYQGVRFRSRLEARWASFFDRLGWAWEYEPLDLSRCIPDFFLRFAPLTMVEVKPATTLDELIASAPKVDGSGWTGTALKLGAWTFDGAIGVMRTDSDPSWRPAHLHMCTGCQKISIEHLCACGGAVKQLTSEEVTRIWREASNYVQYKSPLHTAHASDHEAEPAEYEVTLEQARTQFWQEVDHGTDCPVCDRRAQRYKRKLNAGMARSLITMFRLTVSGGADPDGWVNLTVRELPGLPTLSSQLREDLHKGEIHKTRFWGLVEERPNLDPNRDRDGSGVWRLTPLGMDFCRNRISVPRHVLEYQGESHGASDERTDIETAWGDGFNFDELMNANSHPPRRRRTRSASSAETDLFNDAHGIETV